jgi:hypothetical protein
LDETIGVFQRYDEYLVEIGAASQEMLARARSERGQMFDAGAKTLVNRAQSGKYDGEDGISVAAEDMVVAAVVGGLIELWSQNEREEAEKRRKETAETIFRSYKDTVRLHVARIATRLSANNRWQEGEIGFENLTFEEQFKRRPRDPFIILANAEIREVDEKAEILSRDAKIAFNAARLVPKGSSYDQFRSEMLISACKISALAAYKALSEDPYYQYGKDISREGIQICRTRLEYDPDESHLGKHELAICLNAYGMHQEALSVAATARNQFNNPPFAYNIARFSSLNGLTQQSIEWLERSFQLGISDIRWSRIDPELEDMRNAHRAAFDDLTDVKMTSEIVWGILNDDYQITNNSKFTLTNLVVSPIIIRKSGRTYKKLTAARINSGHTYTWDNAFSISKSEYLGIEFGEWDADQKKVWWDSE